MKDRKEPSRLSSGKAFHKAVQEEWQKTAEGEIRIEKGVTKPSGKDGRVDIFVEDDGCGFVSVAEIKNTDWDRMTERAVKRNARRQIKQIWDYIDSQLAEKREVCTGVIFGHMPKDAERMKLIEAMFEEEGIPVVWHDETIEHRKGRS